MEGFSAAIDESTQVFTKFAGVMKLSQELLDDYKRNPNFCDPWTNQPCFIHTRVSWGCLYVGPCYAKYHEAGVRCPNPGCVTNQ